MNLLTGSTPQIFSLLSIGQRGVGKTTFLAGSYAELHSDSQPDHLRELWFDCQDNQVHENIQEIFSFIAQTGKYPPPTIKITTFNFSLKRNSLRHTKTLLHFRWWDFPGEICNIDDPDFRKMVVNSHSCSVFIDAYALRHNHGYLKKLEQIIAKVKAIATLVSLNTVKYAFAVILTKCDLLEPGPLSRHQLEKRLQPLTGPLDAVRANYQIFYLGIPIVSSEGVSTIKATGAAAPLLWLVWELSLAHHPSLRNNLLKLFTRLQPLGFQPQLEGVDTLPQLLKPTTLSTGVKERLRLYSRPTAPRKLLLLGLAIVPLVGVISLVVNLENIAALHQRRGAPISQAIPVMEKLVQQQPENLELRLQLAHLYESADQLSKAETAYDQILAQQKNNLKALVGKAVLRKTQGDIKTAEALFAQAEKAAPADLKAQVRTKAQKTLQTPRLPMPSAK